MSTLEEARVQYSKALDAARDRLCAQLGRIPSVRRAVLFGSYASGRRDLLTDLDVLVVMDSEVDFITRTAELYRELQLEVDIDLLAYTPAELEEAKSRGFVRRALEEGRVIYERDTA